MSILSAFISRRRNIAPAPPGNPGRFFAARFFAARYFPNNYFH